MMKMGVGMVVVAICLLHEAAFAQKALKTGVQSFAGKLPDIGAAAQGFEWGFDLSREKFYVSVPKNATGAQPCGVFVYISPGDECVSVPQGWESVLRERRLIFVAPQNVGNKQAVARRVGLAILAAAKLEELAKVDTNRIYVAGFSGGARMAAYASFLRPRQFTGVFSLCGVDYCQKVPRVKATNTDEYGYFSVEEGLAEEAKRNVRYVLVTGAKDFRYGNILDIYNGGYLKDGYRVKLIDVPNMEHAICPAKALNEGIAFLEMKGDSVPGKKELFKRGGQR